MAFDIKTLDLELKTRDQVWFVVVVFPVLGVLGGALRVAGVSQEVMSIIVALLTCVAFFAWHIGMAIRRARRSAADAERATWYPRDAHSREYLQQRMHPRSR